MIGDPATRVERIQACLTEALTPAELELVDESHLHAGHAGARSGKGHFRVRIVAEAFEGLAPLARHRRVFQALGELMETDIHALSIEAAAPSDAAGH